MYICMYVCMYVRMYGQHKTTIIKYVNASIQTVKLTYQSQMVSNEERNGY